MKAAKSILSFFLCFSLLFNFLFVGATAEGYSMSQPYVSVLIPVSMRPGETRTGSIYFYSPNGFNYFQINEQDFYISGNGNCELSDFEVVNFDGHGDTNIYWNFKIKATYPGRVSVSFKRGTVFCRAGLPNIQSVPQKMDIKILNPESEDENTLMTNREFYLTALIAPFWKIFDSLKKLFA